MAALVLAGNRRTVIGYYRETAFCGHALLVERMPKVAFTLVNPNGKPDLEGETAPP